MFKPGQMVVVLQAHYGGANDYGTIVRKGEGKEYIGKWWVDLGFTQLPVEPERLVDAEQFWKQQRDKYRT